MNILTTGMGWIDHTPGGLNRYFADYVKAMTQQGHSIRAYITAEARKPRRRNTWKRYCGARTQRHLGPGKGIPASGRKPRFEVDSPSIQPPLRIVRLADRQGQLPRGIPIVTHFHGPWRGNRWWRTEELRRASKFGIV
ncbi:glycosyltransferase family protein [Cohnella faecalis]|uniref:glycosyltransferase family 4 protein n=1 Tax=Cohnella faecalis TaxID=2315694 RepID=UPI0011C22D77|nr:glycosyltransferase family 4 protein [Cohnella faecalis]